MSKLVSLKVTCPGCKGAQNVLIRKPSLLKPVMALFECPDCESIWHFKFKHAQKHHNLAPNTVHIMHKLVHESPALRELRAEEALGK